MELTHFVKRLDACETVTEDLCWETALHYWFSSTFFLWSGSIAGTGGNL